jgi:hypothetical protein
VIRSRAGRIARGVFSLWTFTATITWVVLLAAILPRDILPKEDA